MSDAMSRAGDWIVNTFGIFGIFFLMSFILLWWLYAILALGLAFLGVCALIDGIKFMRHPIANYRRRQEEKRIKEAAEAWRREHPQIVSSSSDDQDSGGGDSGSDDKPNNGGGPDEYGPTPGYGGPGGP